MSDDTVAGSGDSLPTDQAEVQADQQPVAMQVEPESQAGADSDAPSVQSEADPASRIGQLEQELAALREQHENLNGQYMRLAADFDNYRKRQSRDLEDQRLQIACSTLSEILPVVDNFDRAPQQLNPQHE